MSKLKMRKKVIKNYFRILKKTHAHLQTILKTPVKFQKDRPKPVGEVKGTKYLLKIRNHAPRKTKNSVPPLFFEKAGDKKTPKHEISAEYVQCKEDLITCIDFYHLYTSRTVICSG